MKKKISAIIILFTIVIGSIANVYKVKADSGWDSSYDSGGSSSHSSSSSSSYSRSSSSSSSSSRSSDTITTKIEYKLNVFENYLEIIDVKKTYKNSKLQSEREIKKVAIYKDTYPMIYDMLKNLSSSISKSTYCDYIQIKEASSVTIIKIYKSEYPELYNELKDSTIVDANYDNIYDDRIETAKDCVKQVVYKAENPELYNKLKKEIEFKNTIIFITIALVIAFPYLIALILYFVFRRVRKKVGFSLKNMTKTEYKDASDELLNKYGINKEEFKQMMYENYVNVQNGWMNFDYDSLKELLTDELYNTYVSQLDALKIKEEQNIMSDYNKIDAKILNVKEENNQVSVDTYLRITMYDYVVDANKKVIRGNKNHKIDIEYKITYVRPLNTDGEFTCPNCGALLEKTTRGKCKYCRTLIVRPTSNFVMSKKQCIGQRSI